LEIGDFSIFYILYILLAIGLSIQLLLDNKTPQSTFAWILAIFLIPYVGAVIYLMGGLNWRRRKIVQIRPEEVFGEHMRSLLDVQTSQIADSYSGIGSDITKILTITMKTGNAIVTQDNLMDVFHRGGDKFEQLFKDLEQAQKSIHLEYFIFRDDEVGNRIIDILERKAKEGLEVRMLVDGAGSRPTLSRKTRRRLRKGPIEFRNFLDPANIVSAWLINYSMHRKIVVIDGEIAYTGGMNIGKEYIDGQPRFENWRDTHLRFPAGGVVFLLQAVFIADWVNSGGQVEEYRDYLQTARSRSNAVEDGYRYSVQMLCSGPDSQWYSIHKLYLTMIANANKKVLIQSPYFVPDESIAATLETAALSGVEIALMMTGKPDKWIPFWVAHTFYEPLLKAGVRIFLYEAGFFHVKAMIIDDLLVTTGSCNMDQRSFFLDYELNVVVYDQKFASEMTAQFEKDLESCREVTLEDYHAISRAQKFRNSVFRTIAPLL
jgi:cardiolipin synthase A/B